MNFKSFFLPCGIILAIIISILFPEPGAYCKEIGLLPVCVIVIFVINGYKTDFSKLNFNKKNLSISVLLVVISLILAPFLGMGISKLLFVLPALGVGLIVMSSVPPTLSSGIVLTEISKGNPLLALILTVFLNLIGIITIPFMLKFTLDFEGNIAISPWKLLSKLLMIVLVPLIAGIVVKNALRKDKPPAILDYIPSSCVILSVLFSLSFSRESLMGLDPKMLILIITGSLTVHLTLMLFCFLATKIIKSDNSDRNAALFVGSQKTLPVALTVIAALNFTDGATMVVCIVFHFSQLIADSFIATKLTIKAAVLGES